MTRKTIIYGTCARRSQNFIKLLFKKIAQRYISGVVKTAGNNSSIHEYANLVAQGIAESLFLFVLLTLAVGPLKHACIL